eukprot:m.67181 g.67181  ORF g.67181 m.67181 type:complete len:365 (+) comp9851_c0_seq1:3382-4476(+)
MCGVVMTSTCGSENLRAPPSAVRSSRDLGVAEVHLGVGLLELLKHGKLVLLVRGRQPGLLLPLVVHHLLDHATGLAVQVAELGVLRLNLAGVHLLVRRHNVRPPLHLVDLFQLDHNLAAVREDPGALVREATLGEVAVNDHGLPLEPHLERLNPNIHNTVTALVPSRRRAWKRDPELNVLKRLGPRVVLEGAAVASVRHELALGLLVVLVCFARLRQRLARLAQPDHRRSLGLGRRCSGSLLLWCLLRDVCHHLLVVLHLDDLRLILWRRRGPLAVFFFLPLPRSIHLLLCDSPVLSELLQHHLLGGAVHGSGVEVGLPTEKVEEDVKQLFDSALERLRQAEEHPIVPFVCHGSEQGDFSKLAF